MKREAERETDDRGQKELIKCCHLEMLRHQWRLIDPNVCLWSRVTHTVAEYRQCTVALGMFYCSLC